jgi:hypothetical protein
MDLSHGKVHDDDNDADDDGASHPWTYLQTMVH